jgi:hypothetical protein
MKAQFTNKLVSSFLMYLDNVLLTKGEAFYNTTGYFYASQSPYSAYYAYAAPCNPVVYDQSISNSIPFSGVYLDRTFITTGQSGLAQLDYRKGLAYFSSEITGSNRISGNFSCSEFTVQLTTEPEYRLIFETKKFLRPKYSQNLTGVAPNEISFPTIFVKENGGYNDPYALGGEDITYSTFRLVILGDSQFSTDAVTSLLKDQTHSYVPLMFDNEFPFNAYGGLKNTPYNYTGTVAGRVSIGSGVFLEKVQVISMTQGFRGDLSILQPAVYPAIVDLTLCMPRFTR